MMGDFLFETGGQIVLQAAKLRYMSNGQVSVPMVVRAGVGAIKNAGPAPQRIPTTRCGHIAQG